METPQKKDKDDAGNNAERSSFTKRSDTGKGEVIVESDPHSKMVWFLAGALVLVVAGVWYFMIMNPNGEAVQEGSPEARFQEDIVSAGQLARSGDIAAALDRFSTLIETASTPEQEGQAKLNLGVWRLGSDQVAAIELLKEVSLNEFYAPFTRAKATNYVLNKYVATYDETLAREHVFVGPVWGDFVQEGEEPSIHGVINGFEFSMSLQPTPEASSRLAQEYAVQIIENRDLSQTEKDQLAQKALNAINEADDFLQTLSEEGEIAYGGTDFTEVAVSYNRKGKALDVLYFQGYIDDPERVEEAFQDGINTVLEHQGGVGTELYLRYFYADFLLRLDAENRKESIQKILAPMSKMHSDNTIASFFRSWVTREDLNDFKSENDLARPDNVVRLAQISPEFRDALLRVGVTEAELSPDQGGVE